jgi:hypothetical protein
MTVDFAYKQWDRGNEGYALRSLKLGVSRKLIYGSGLLACFWCDPRVSLGGYERVGSTEKTWVLNQELKKMFELTPLERFARFFLTHQREDFLRESANHFFKAYDDFLALLDDANMRNHLEALPPNMMDYDQHFKTARVIRTRFEEAIREVFLRPESLLYQHTITRGVF